MDKYYLINKLEEIVELNEEERKILDKNKH